MTFDSSQYKRLEEYIKLVEADEIGHLRQGVFDLGMYRDRCGYLRALDHVRAEMEKIESNIRQGK